MPYFQHKSWAPFVYGGVSHDLAHLDEYELTIKDTGGVDRRIAVTFGDHCFTCEAQPGYNPTLVYPTSSRRPGLFSFDRYHHSLGLVEHIAQATQGQVWSVGGDNFAVVSGVNHLGKQVSYNIIFSLDRVRRLPIPIDLRMHVKTAYPGLEPPVTFGSTRFRHLVALRMQGKGPGRITTPGRKVPRLP